MSRTQNKKNGSTLLIVIAVVCLVVVVVAVLKWRSNSLSGLERFPCFRLYGQARRFPWQHVFPAGADRHTVKMAAGHRGILAVEVEGAAAPLPVFIPENAGGNIQPGQRFDMRVQIQDGGLIYVEDLRKY